MASIVSPFSRQRSLEFELVWLIVVLVERLSLMTGRFNKYLWANGVLSASSSRVFDRTSLAILYAAIILSELTQSYEAVLKSMT